MTAAHTTLALIHGLGASRRCWEPVLPQLAAAGLRAAPIELPGYGARRSREPARTIEAMAADAMEQIARLMPERLVIVGHSMGGLVATAIAEATPDLADRIVLVNSSLTVASRMTAHRGTEGLIARPLIGRVAWRAAPRRKLREGLRSAFAPGFAVPEGFVDDLQACSWATFTRSGAAMDAYLGERALPDRLHALSTPWHLVYGMQDLRIDQAAIGAVCADADGLVTRIDGAGHTPSWERPLETAEAIIGAARSGAPAADDTATAAGSA